MKASPATKGARGTGRGPQREHLAFELLYHSVYDGRQRLGYYVRIAPTRYAAYDTRDRLLGKFDSKRAAFAAVSRKGRSAQRGVQ
jgi:hypothetical protein